MIELATKSNRAIVDDYLNDLLSVHNVPAASTSEVAIATERETVPQGELFPESTCARFESQPELSETKKLTVSESEVVKDEVSYLVPREDEDDVQYVELDDDSDQTMGIAGPASAMDSPCEMQPSPVPVNLPLIALSFRVRSHFFAIPISQVQQMISGDWQAEFDPEQPWRVGSYDVGGDSRPVVDPSRLSHIGSQFSDARSAFDAEESSIQHSHLIASTDNRIMFLVSEDGGPVTLHSADVHLPDAPAVGDNWALCETLIPQGYVLNVDYFLKELDKNVF
ncbi:MAG: hypothetical protein AAF434_05520 [Pseudomonadota bacterium]